MRALLNQAAEIAARYLETLDERAVAPTPDALARLAELHHPLPDGPQDPIAVLEMFDRIGSPATSGVAGRRYFGFVTGGSLPAALAANWLAGAWDQCPGLFAASPIGAVLEEVSLRWLLDLLRLPSESGGAFVTGATMANFTALAAARHSVWNAPDGTWRRTDCSARRQSRWWWEARCIRRSSRRLGCWAWDVRAC